MAISRFVRRVALAFMGFVAFVATGVVGFFRWLYRGIVEKVEVSFQSFRKAAFSAYQVRNVFQRNIYKERSFIFT